MKNKHLFTLIILFLGLYLFSTTLSYTDDVVDEEIQISIIDQIAYSVIRLTVVKSDGTEHTGTGFIYKFSESDKSFIPVIVTNKHVINDSTIGYFHVNLADDDGNPIPRSFEKIKIKNFEKSWIEHPDKDVDLAIMPIGPLLNSAKNQKINIYIKALDSNLIPTDQEFKTIGAVQDIIMVGYPLGIWDEVNNYPIFRTGITATTLANDYNGREEFLIDAACYPGSSGSPIFLYNDGSYGNANGIVIGSRLKFLGILYQGPIYTPEGELEFKNIPTSKNVGFYKPHILINLGKVIKSSELLKFNHIIKKKLKSKKNIQ